METVVGLDMSLTGTGVCVIGDDIKLHTINSTPQMHRNIYDRVDYIVTKCFECMSVAPSMICIEAPFTHLKNPSSAIPLAALGHMMRRALVAGKHAFRDVAATQLKKFCLGKGAGGKELILREVYKKWGIEARDNNQADAAVLAHIAIGMLQVQKGNAEGLAKYQLEVIEKCL